MLWSQFDSTNFQLSILFFTEIGLQKTEILVKYASSHVTKLIHGLNEIHKYNNAIFETCNKQKIINVLTASEN